MQMGIHVNFDPHQIDPSKHSIAPTFIKQRFSNGFHIAVGYRVDWSAGYQFSGKHPM
tara:strand:- start:3446 stop:3616 length:171 start_codon:yes stop_codon:yes gene_type:complete